MEGVHPVSVLMPGNDEKPTKMSFHAVSHVNQSIKFQCFVTWGRGRATCVQTSLDGYGPIERGKAEWPRAEGYLG